jgi:hypothetical protein
MARNWYRHSRRCSTSWAAYSKLAGKTAAVKVNFIGNSWNRLGHYPLEDTSDPSAHDRGDGPPVRGPVRAGFGWWKGPLECRAAEFMMSVNWNVADILNAAPKVEFENTNLLGTGRSTPAQRAFRRLGVPAYDLNHAYEDCDVFVSLAKLKEHNGTGITLSMKNVYGIRRPRFMATAPARRAHAAPDRRTRSVCHGQAWPVESAPQELDQSTPRRDRLPGPRITVELCRQAGGPRHHRRHPHRHRGEWPLFRSRVQRRAAPADVRRQARSAIMAPTAWQWMAWP